MRWLALGTVVLFGSSAFAGGKFRVQAEGQLGPAWGSLGQPSWVNRNPTGYPVPLVPITRNTPYYPQQIMPVWYYYPVVQQPAPAPAPQVIIEREVIIERAAPEPAAPPPAPQVIVIEQPAPVVQAPAPVVAPEPPKAPLPPRTPGPDVYSWTDEDGVVNYSTRAPADGKSKAKKLATLAK